MRADAALSSYLSQQITKGPSDEGSAGLGGQRTFVQSPVVGSPSRDGTSTNEGRVTEERALAGRTLAEGRLDDVIVQRAGRNRLGDERVRRDSEGADASSGDKEETEELHGELLFQCDCNYFQTIGL